MSVLPPADLAAPDLHVTALGILTSEVLLSLHALQPERYPVLLETAGNSQHRRQHDVLLAFPGQRLECRANGVGFLAELDQWWQRERLSVAPRALPFTGGWFLYLGYELAQQIESSLKLPGDDTGLTALATRVPAAIQRRSDTGETWFVAEAGMQAEAQRQQVLSDLNQAGRVPLPHARVNRPQEDTPEMFIAAVQTALTHIAAGDIYQANLSRRWQAQLQSGNAAALYQRLKRRNPAPFAALARLEADHQLISSSPERLLELRDGWASTRPIAGTRPRHADPEMDRQLLRELKAHPKERAEHIMLLDLERSDLGRICLGGSVEVNEYMSIESYAHVHHIVSNVRGRLRADLSPGQAIAAVFPGGTITGVPKVRCMQIIADLEGMPRGAYTGSMGYLNHDGSLDLNILIRTLELRGEQLSFRAGAGIVADSDPALELEETRAKALGLLRALQD